MPSILSKWQSLNFRFMTLLLTSETCKGKKTQMRVTTPPTIKMLIRILSTCLTIKLKRSLKMQQIE